jgi:hypothetical protein
MDRTDGFQRKNLVPQRTCGTRRMVRVLMLAKYRQRECFMCGGRARQLHHVVSRLTVEDRAAFSRSNAELTDKDTRFAA